MCEVRARCDARLNRDEGRFGNPSTKVIEADLSTYDPFDLMDELGLKPGDLDVLVGGPPCQSFSTAGRRGTIEDPRGQLLWDYLRFVDAFKPRYFLMENVRGLLSAGMKHRPIAERPERGGVPLTPEERPGSVVDAWVEDLHKIDGGAYRVDSFEVNAVNYGAPQLRERVLFIGTREGHLIDFPQPTHGPTDDAPQRMPFTALGEVLEGFEEPDPVLMDFSPRKKQFLAQVPPGGNWRMLPPEVAQESMGRAYFAKGGRSGWWRRLSWDLPCPTITTLPNHSSTSMCHPFELRVLSVGESAHNPGIPRRMDLRRHTGTTDEAGRKRSPGSSRQGCRGSDPEARCAGSRRGHRAASIPPHLSSVACQDSSVVQRRSGLRVGRARWDCRVQR